MRINDEAGSFEITLLKPQKRFDRLNIFLNGDFAFSLSHELVYQEKLKIGQLVNLDYCRRLLLEDWRKRLFGIACNFLSFRPRSCWETRRYLKIKLARKGEGFKNSFFSISPTDLEEQLELAILRLQELDYINDTKFAQWWVSQRQSSKKPLGPSLIRNELLSKGVKESDFRAFLTLSEQQISSAANTAFNNAKKRFRNYPKDVSRQKIIAYLKRRGFTWSTIKELLSLT